MLGIELHLHVADLVSQFLGLLESLLFSVLTSKFGIPLVEANACGGFDLNILFITACLHCFSIANEYSPRRAALLHVARCNNAFCAAGTLVSSPCQMCMAGS